MKFLIKASVFPLLGILSPIPSISSAFGLPLLPSGLFCPNWWFIDFRKPSWESITAWKEAFLCRRYPLKRKHWKAETEKRKMLFFTVKWKETATNKFTEVCGPLMDWKSFTCSLAQGCTCTCVQYIYFQSDQDNIAVSFTHIKTDQVTALWGFREALEPLLQSVFPSHHSGSVWAASAAGVLLVSFTWHNECRREGSLAISAGLNPATCFKLAVQQPVPRWLPRTETTRDPRGRFKPQILADLLQ